MERPKHLKLLDESGIARPYIKPNSTEKEKIKQVRMAIKRHREYIKRCEELDIKKLMLEKQRIIK
jgi:hypothetical protein